MDANLAGLMCETKQLIMRQGCEFCKSNQSSREGRRCRRTDYLRCLTKESERAWGWVYLSAVASLSTSDGEFDSVLRRAMAGMACETQRKARTARMAIMMYGSMEASLQESKLTTE